jgi:hypothetical protein
VQALTAIPQYQQTHFCKAIEESKMSVLEKEMQEIRRAKSNIQAGVDTILYTNEHAADSVTRTREAATDIRKNCGIMSDQIILGSDAVAESLVQDAREYARWQHTLQNAARFTFNSSRLISEHAKTVENPDMRESIAYARGALDTTEQVALEQRRRGVIVSLNGPLAEYALQDGESMGIIGTPKEKEAGIVLGKASEKVVLQREDGTMVAVPTIPKIYQRINVGDAVGFSYIGHDYGGYRLSSHVEKQQKVNEMEAKKQEYPRLEAHLKAPDKTWHSASLYQDREGHPRGAIAIENADKGIKDKYMVVYAEKVSEKTGEKFLSAKIDREDGKQLFVTIMPHEKDGNRWLAASFAERDREKEKGHQLTPITGKGGELKPNAALLEKADVDRTAKYVRETFKVDPVQAHQRSVERKSSGLGLGVAK